MRRPTRSPVMLALMGVLTSMLVFVSPGTASAAVPTLKWPAVTANPLYGKVVTSPSGDVTVGCSNDSPAQDLTTYSSTGVVVRQISRTMTIDGVQNCVTEPVVDKNGTIYGVPYGTLTTGGTGYGPNLLAYNGDTLAWKYPVGCGSDRREQWAVGADGNIYATTYLSDGVHLIGLTPNVAAGQTQPTKVLDVKLPQNDCSTRVRPYKDGLMLHGRSSGNARYYSYSGKYLGQAGIGSIAYEKLNADGKLFVPSYVSGSYTSAKISMYDPRKGGVVWETIASTSGANINDVRVYPMPEGGAAAIINEQKMISGIPAVPTEYINTLVVLDSNGLKTRSVSLKNAEANGDMYNAPIVYPDVNGKLVVVRDMYLKTNVSWPNTVEGISIATYDPATDTWPYQQVMSGNANNGSGPLYGYRQHYAGSSGPVLGNGAVFVVGYCSGSCPTPGSKLYPIAISGVGMDYPRGDVLSANTAAQPAPLPSVALGDSYSSGQGAGTYDDGTVTSTNRCYKSLDAYGRISDRDPNSALSLTSFAACGGSVTTDIETTGTYTGVSPQDTALSSTTKVVTISIGGNDIGFADVIKTCADPTKDCDSAFNLANNQLSVLDNKLQSTYLDILQKAPLAQVYVLGYPPLLASGSSGCWVGNNGGSAPFFSADRIQKGVTLSESLNTSIENNVNTIRALGTDYQRLHFVDAMAAGSPFIGHDVCSSDPYVNGLILSPGDSSESFHPNTKGQKAYADLLLAAMTP